MTEERLIVDPVTGGKKGQKRARFSLIPPEFLWALAEHFGHGAAKYEDRNWERGYAWSLCVDALGRHLLQWLRGESYDPDTGSHHLIAVAWHCCALYTFEVRGLGTDDVRAGPRGRGGEAPQRPRIYIAGPISKGDRRENVRRAFEVADQLLRAGFAPFVPHASCLVEDALGHEPATVGSARYEEWLELDFSFLACCDAVLRLPGESAGADREVAFARARGLPVYESVDALVAAQRK